MEVYDLSNWEKFCIISWKNFLVTCKNYKQALCCIFFPPTLMVILVLFRLVVDVNQRPTREFRKISMNTTLTELFEEIEGRRTIIKRTNPNFKHSVYVPQPIVAYAPDSNRFQEVMNDALESIQVKGRQTFKTCEEVKAAMRVEHFFAGVCFMFNESVSTRIETVFVFPSELRIFYDSYISATWSTNDFYDLYNSFEVRHGQTRKGGYIGYYREGFVALQNSVALAYIKHESKKKLDIPDLYLKRFPYRNHMDDKFTRNIKVSISLFLVCGYLFPVFVCTYKIVQEKNSEVKKIFKAMGVGNFIHIVAWFTKYSLLLFMSSVVTIIILKIQWKLGRGILPQTSPFALLLILFAYNTATVSYCIMMSTFFSDVFIAVPLTGITWICTYLPYVASKILSNWTTDLEPLMFFFCNTVLALIFDQVVGFEKTHMPLNLLERAPTPHRSHFMSPGAYVGTLFGLSLFYLLVALYLEEINLKHMLSWCKVSLRSQPRESKVRMLRRETVVNEIEPEYKNIILRVENLNKYYNSGFALKKIEVNFYEGDITVFMGHNGSGKTSFLEILAGFTNPSSGKIYIEDIDAIKYKIASRKNVGICMHEGLLFDELTTVDQLTLFARLRGLRGQQLEKEVNRYIKTMNLTSRSKWTTNMLSPGKRRFLAICCALIGSCKLVLLDEPSKSLDIFDKKSLWELFRIESRVKTIILTSHSEEEAEALGDRVGILCNGELKCFGSSFFLKKVYGQGHRLILFKRKEYPRHPITLVVQRHSPNAFFENEIGSQLNYVIEDIGSFTELFDELENDAENLGILGISISEMNSADIFLKMGVQELYDNEWNRPSVATTMEINDMKDNIKMQLDGGMEKVTGLHLIVNQCEVLLVKRVIHSVRNLLLGILKLTMPILFTTVSFALLYNEQQQNPLKKLTYGLKEYPNSATAYHIHQDAALKQFNVAIFKAYVEQLFAKGLYHRGEEIPSSLENVNNVILQKQRERGKRLSVDFDVGMDISKDHITAYYDNFPLHTIPLALNLVHNAILRSISPTATLQATLDPLPYDSPYSTAIKSLPNCVANYLAINVSFCLGFTFTLSVIFLIRERRQLSKFFQTVCGVRAYIFWLTTFIFDIIVIIISTLLVLLTIAIFEKEKFSEEVSSGTYFLILLISGICMCSGNYLTSMLFDRPILAYIFITLFNTIGTMSWWAHVEIFHHGFRQSTVLGPYIGPLRVFPYFSLCSALVTCFNMAELSSVCRDPEIRTISENLMNCTVVPKCCNTFNIWNFRTGILTDLMFIFAFGIICWIVIFILETYKSVRGRFGLGEKKIRLRELDISRSLTESRSLKILQESTEKEQQDVINIDPVNDKSKILVCNQLCAKLGKKFSLNYVSFMVNRGEIFSILGESGSGKSFLIKSVLGRIPIKSGRIHINSTSLFPHAHKIYKRVGICLQDDVFLEEYQVYELMRMTCLLRGIPNYQIRDICDYLAKLLGFSTHLKKRLCQCSPGLRKRFYCGCALIGCPDIIFFDESLTSLDIAGQRQLLKIFCDLREQGQTIVLASSTTQNIESIVDNLLILSKGSVIAKCDPWDLSEKYTKCYSLKMKVKKIRIAMQTSASWDKPRSTDIVNANAFLNLADFIESKFPLYKVRDQLGNIVEYFIPVQSTTMSDIFKIMQRHSFNLYVESFTISTVILPLFFSDALETFEENLKETVA